MVKFTVGVGQDGALVVKVFPFYGGRLFYLYVCGGRFGDDWQVFQDSLIDSMLNTMKL